MHFQLPSFKFHQRSADNLEPEAMERIFSWRMQVHMEQCAMRESASVASLKSRQSQRQSKPYLRPQASYTSSHTQRSSVMTGLDGIVGECKPSAGRPQELKMVSVPSHWPIPKISGPMYRRSSDLPDPERNPLVTTRTADLEEEYSRVIGLYRGLQDKKAELEFSWLEYPYPETIQQLMDVGVSLQRVISSARYIVDYSRTYGFDVDFQALFIHEPDSPSTLP